MRMLSPSLSPSLLSSPGLVHVSQLRQGTTRILKVEDWVKRNQPIKVKVLNMIGQRISLSMKEVDQDTGADLNPGRQEIARKTALDDVRNNPMAAATARQATCHAAS